MAKPRYGRVPDEVGFDPGLSAHDVRVYWMLARGTFQGKTHRVGVRLIAELIHVSEKQVRLSIKNLEKCGHLTTATEKGKRTTYVLNSPVFGQKQGKAHEVVSCPRGHKRLVSVDKERIA